MFCMLEKFDYSTRDVYHLVVTEMEFFADFEHAVFEMWVYVLVSISPCILTTMNKFACLEKFFKKRFQGLKLLVNGKNTTDQTLFISLQAWENPCREQKSLS